MGRKNAGEKPPDLLPATHFLSEDGNIPPSQDPQTRGAIDPEARHHWEIDPARFPLPQKHLQNIVVQNALCGGKGSNRQLFDPGTLHSFKNHSEGLFQR
jgi:hypothetical protein